MQKIIVSRFPAKCRKCSGAIAAGDKVFWFGKGEGVQHTHSCGTAEDSKVKSDGFSGRSYTERFTELRDKFRKLSAGDTSFLTRSKNREVANYLLSMWNRDSTWIGCTLPEMNQWLSEGFTVEGLAGVDSSLFPAKPRRKMKYGEEGDEMQIDLIMSGVDKHFIEWEKRFTKPGLKVEIRLCFNANFQAKIIADYERWIARMLQSIDEAGIDCEIAISNRASNVYRQDSYSDKSETRVIVKESGEASDFASWSAMFSPGGFRMLSFLSIVNSGDHHGRDVSPSLGSAVYDRSWIVEYDEDENTLTVANPGSSSEFPEFEMTERFKAILTKIGG